jgi:hypothetical protein
MKASVIITDPKKMSQICSQQPTVSQAEMKRSVLAGIRSGSTPRPVNASLRH